MKRNYRRETKMIGGGINYFEYKSMTDSVFFFYLIYKDETDLETQELPWDLTDDIDCAETEAVGLLRSRSPLMAFGFPLNLSIASWQMSSNHSSSGSSLIPKLELSVLKSYMTNHNNTKCVYTQIVAVAWYRDNVIKLKNNI